MKLAMSQSKVESDEGFEADVSREWVTGIERELDKPAMLDARYGYFLIPDTGQTARHEYFRCNLVPVYRYSFLS